MKIALVILHADPARGGAERYTVDLARALARRGHEVSILASDFAAPVEKVGFEKIGAGGFTRAGRYRRFLDNLDAHLAGTKYEIVHAMLPVRRCDLYHPHAGIAAEELAKWNVHLNPRRKAMAEVERELMTDSSGPVVLCLSEYVKGFAVKHYPLPAQRMATLFNAVDLARFEPVRAEHVGTTALIIANDYERKGLEQVIRALAIVGPLNLKLDVVGKEEPGKYDVLAKDLEVADAVAFLGAVSDPRPRYAAADFFVLPTKHDPCSLVVLEALAMGLPVISTKFNGACEVMTDGVHGFVLDDPEDAGALAAAMKKMLEPARREEMRKACLELRPRLSYETHLDRLEEVYGDVIKSRGDEDHHEVNG